MVNDAIVNHERRKQGGYDPQPEKRLKGIWHGAILTPVTISPFLPVELLHRLC
jgi:hypothetical protein